MNNFILNIMETLMTKYPKIAPLCIWCIHNASTIGLMLFISAVGLFALWY